MDDEKTILQDLPSDIKGFVCEDADGFHTVVLNAHLNHEQLVETYKHEEAHIRCDDLHCPASADYIERERRNA